MFFPNVKDDAAVTILAAGSIALYGVILTVYRTMFSPLAKFPGPRIAAITGWYEFYYDFWKDGKYIFEIEKMHQKYGPIVRVNPHELMINDPEFYNEVYVAGSRRRSDKYDGFFQGLSLEGSHLLTMEHDLHRRRRKPLDPYFSRLGVSRLQPMLAEVTRKLSMRLESLQGTNTIVRLDHAFFCFSQDVVGRVCWENKEDFLDDPEFSPEWYEMLYKTARAVPLFTAFPVIIRIVECIPERILLRLFPVGQLFQKIESMARKHIESVKHVTPIKKPEEGDGDDQVSVFRYLVNSDMPASEMSDERLAREAKAMLGAGTVTPARTLTFISYYLLANADMRSLVEEELRSVMASFPTEVPSWTELERLPFFQAVIKEGLRLTWGGGFHRFPRCSPDSSIQYKKWTIPPKVPVGMSIYLNHSNPLVFKDPFKFIPERWLGDIDPAMDRSFTPFSRGSRSCTGMNLALAEISLALAALFRPEGPKFELFETDESDVKHVHDFVIPMPRIDSKGVRVIVR